VVVFLAVAQIFFLYPQNSWSKAQFKEPFGLTVNDRPKVSQGRHLAEFSVGPKEFELKFRCSDDDSDSAVVVLLVD
jgi:hypothetical protein